MITRLFQRLQSVSPGWAATRGRRSDAAPTTATAREAVINRLRCLLVGHPWPDWSAWSSAGCGRFYRERHCPRCDAHQVERDG